MRYRKRNGKKAKEDPISSIPPEVPPSNSVGQNPREAFKAALVRERAKRELTRDEQLILDHLEAGYDPKQIAHAFRWNESWVKERKEYISAVLSVILIELQTTL